MLVQCSTSIDKLAVADDKSGAWDQHCETELPGTIITCYRQGGGKATLRPIQVARTHIGRAHRLTSDFVFASRKPPLHSDRFSSGNDNLRRCQQEASAGAVT